jgi:hypothetical protein
MNRHVDGGPRMPRRDPESLPSVTMSNPLDQYAFGHIPHQQQPAASVPPAPASVLSRDTQGDRNMRDAEPEREDSESIGRIERCEA